MQDKKDNLGNRMKAYESQSTFQKLSHLTPIVARLDGRSFHTFTAGLKRPYDEGLSNLMAATTKYLVQATNANLGYTQSDEISLIWVNQEEKVEREIFFDGKVFKMQSLLAAMCSVYFNKHLAKHLPEKAAQIVNDPMFDCRVFSVPTLTEATNYLYWREKDATKNSISMAAQSVYSHNALHGKNSSDKQEMLYAKGINWNNYPDFFKKGTYFYKRSVSRPYSIEELDKLPAKHLARNNPELVILRQEVVPLVMPPLSRIGNRVDVLFKGQEPISKS